MSESDPDIMFATLMGQLEYCDAEQREIIIRYLIKMREREEKEKSAKKDRPRPKSPVKSLSPMITIN
jgi:hypothetical protein